MNVALRAPRVTLAICLLVLVAAAAGLPRLTLSSDTRVFFTDDDPLLLQLQAFERKYGQNNSVLIAVQPRAGKVTAPSALAAVGDLTDRAWRLPHSTRVESLTNFPRIVADDDSFSVVELVAAPARTSDADAREIERIALADPLIVDRLISEDARTGGLIVSFDLPEEASNEVREVIVAVRALEKQFERDYPQIDLHATGNVMLMGAFSEAAIGDVTLLVPISLAATCMLLLIFIRSLAPVIAVVSLLGLSSTTAMGIAAWAGHIVNPASVAAPVIIMTVNMAAAVHVVTGMMREMALGRDRADALAASMQTNFGAITLTSITTMIGFLAMNLADSPPINDQGNIVAGGILLSYLFTFTWLPAALLLLPVRPSIDNSEQLMERLGEFVNRRYRSLALVMAVVCVLSAIGLTQIRLDDDFPRYFDDRFEFRQASDFVEDNLTGLNVIDFDLGAGAEGGVYEPAYQRKVAAFADWLKSQDGVVSVLAIPEITRRIHRAMNVAGDDAVDGIPGNPDLISQYFLLYELSLPFGAEITDQINVSRSSSRVTAILRGQTSGDIRALNLRATEWLARNAPPAMHASGISINVLFSNLSTQNIRSMIGSTAVSILIIGLIIGFALRSWSLGILSLGTNLLPALIGFGIWGFLIGDIGLAASVITATTIGIVVDDTIHFLMKYRNLRRQGMATEDAVTQVFGTVGVAMLVTTVSVSVGFLVLVLSGFEVNRSLGAQTAIIISAALLVDWFLLPPLLRLGVAERRSGGT